VAAIKDAPIFFLSYAREDSEFARKLAADLQALGFRTWLDQSELEVGVDFVDQIKRAIDTADYLLVLMSKRSLRSIWIMKEVELASGKGQGLVVPVLIDKDAAPLVPPHLAQIQWLDLSDPKSYSDQLSHFARQVKAKKSPQESKQEAQSRQKPKQEPLDGELLTLADILNSDEFAERIANQVAAVMAKAGATQSQSTRTIELAENFVFVIMSYSEDMEPIFEGIKVAAEASGFIARRVKDIVGDYQITSTITESIQRACIVVVDLTHERPNVYFELGYARGLGKTVITTARDGTNIHFDVKDWTCTFYSDSRILERDLKKRFAIERNRLKGIAASLS
jgi:TIR domain